MSDFRKELAETAKKITRPGYGILAADESGPTIGKKFTGVGIENTEENRVNYRNLLFTAPGLNEYISGIILFDETARGNAPNGKPFLELIHE